MHITFLGTGTSHGVPALDCMRDNFERCPYQVCLKALREPRHRRSRSSIYIEQNGVHLLCDTSQDFREQMLRERVRRLDAVLLTHGHADHIYGMPDIRSYTHHDESPMPVYASTETLSILTHAFAYIFQQPAFIGGGIPVLDLRELSSPTSIRGVDVTPVPVVHGPLNGCLGFRLGNVAYLPDVHSIPETSLTLLSGLDLLISNCLRQRPHSSHLSLAESLYYAGVLQPKQVLLTHMTHDIDYEREERALPANVRFAYDGLQVQV